MSTTFNHYEKPPCPTCGHRGERRHIGLSSVGWNFMLHVYPSEGINDLADWRERWKTGEIYNQYGDLVTPAQMDIIVSGRAPGLRRHPIGSQCIRHGAGTWDCVVGNFS